MVECRKCGKEIHINAMKKCYWCPDCRLRGPAVTEDEVVESEGGITVAMIREICRDMIKEAMSPRVQLTGLDEKTQTELIEKGQKEKDEKLWRENAKAYGVALYDQEKKCPRKKEDVLAELADLMTSPQKEDDNEAQ